MSDGLQFDRAEFQAPQGEPAPGAVGPRCNFCGQPVQRYWAVGDKLACASCHGQVRYLLDHGQGSSIERFLRAALLGTLAAIVGAVLWYVVIRIIKGQLGLVALAVGWLVGAAVRAGSYHRGGWVYQVLALLLTYCAVAGAQIPILARSEAYFDAHPQATTVDLEAVLPLEPSGLNYLVGALRSPLEPFNHSMIGMLIVAFGLYEAWRQNARREVPVTGPHDVGAGAPPSAGPPGPAPTA
jgi:hypothetical protein